MRTLITIGVVLCLVAACSTGKDAKKKDDNQHATDTATAPADPGTADKPAAEPSEEDKQKARMERIAKARERNRETAAEELKRWTDDLRAQVKQLVESDYKDVKSALEAAVKSPHRVPGNADRDGQRHPVETLAFLGLKPDMTVIEAGMGGGWYSEIIAPVVAKRGQFRGASYDPDGPADSFLTVYGERAKLFMDKSPEIFGNAQLIAVEPPDKLSLGAPGSTDLVIAIREMHNWQRRDYLDKYVAAIYDVLKPGGIFGVVQHRSKAGTDGAKTADTGYLPQDWVVAQVEKAGFKLDASSEINANPKDTTDHPEGVWTLPPRLALDDKDRDKYTAIGESDRMTLRFVKPAK